MGSETVILLWEVLAQGGWTMLPLYACSAVSLRKLFEYRVLHLSDLSWYQDVVQFFLTHAGYFFGNYMVRRGWQKSN